MYVLHKWKPMETVAIIRPAFLGLGEAKRPCPSAALCWLLWEAGWPEARALSLGARGKGTEAQCQAVPHSLPLTRTL